MPKKFTNDSNIKETKKVTPIGVPKTHPSYVKTIRNLSLQAWPIPTGNGSIKLTPGQSVQVPVSAISERVLNLQRRRLISIS